MAVVARVLPRDWDARRLLRFLAGLAMLALAFAAPALPAPFLPAPATPAMVTTVTVAQADETPVTVSESAPAPLGVRGEPALPVPAGVLAVLIAVVVLPLAGRVGRVRGERAPPAV